jgi:hypothetical protein
VNKYRKVNPQLVPVSDKAFESMVDKLNRDIDAFGFAEVYGKVQF